MPHPGLKPALFDIVKREEKQGNYQYKYDFFYANVIGNVAGKIDHTPIKKQRLTRMLAFVASEGGICSCARPYPIIL
jgi:hypothetical protein